MFWFFSNRKAPIFLKNIQCGCFMGILKWEMNEQNNKVNGFANLDGLLNENQIKPGGRQKILSFTHTI